MSYYVNVALGPRERDLLLRLLKNDDSYEADGIRWQIEDGLEKARERARKDREHQAHRDRHDAANVVTRLFAERHAESFPGSRGLNQTVGRWIDHHAQLALGLEPYGKAPQIRAEYEPRARMALDALLAELQTPDGMRRAVTLEIDRLRTQAVSWRTEYVDYGYAQEMSAEYEATADRLERAGELPGLDLLRKTA